MGGAPGGTPRLASGLKPLASFLADIGFSRPKSCSVAFITARNMLRAVAVLAATACAFAPARVGRQPVALRGAYEDAVGSSAYTGAFA